MIKLIDLLKEEINLEKYVEDWLSKGGTHDDSSINRAFTIKLKQLGYKNFGTIYRVLIVKDIDRVSNLKSYIWNNYKGKYLSFSKTLEGAYTFIDLTSENLYEGETFVVIKQKSNYYDLSKWVQDKEKEYGVNQFYADKGYWVGGLYNETQKTQEVLATLDNSFEIQGQYSNDNDDDNDEQ
jgi:hypothetical protein